MDRTQRIVLTLVGAAVVYLVLRGDVVSADTVVFFVILVASVILHEVSHGAAALVFGDDTAKRAGRLTLNPIAHVDPVGTIILPAVLVLAAGMAFGYAKPVPVNPRRMRHPRNHGLLVALAGPGTNIVLALAAAALLAVLSPPGLEVVARYLGDGRLVDLSESGWSIPARLAFDVGVVNVILAAFNLIPIPPLDGSAVVERFLPRQWWDGYLRLRQYAMPVLLVLVLFVPSFLTAVFTPALRLWSLVL